MTLGARLKKARELKGWSQLYVSERSNISNTALSNYERNYREPDAETLNKLADLYEVKVDYLLGRTNDSSPTSQKKMEPDHDGPIYIAYLGGPPKELDEEEAAHLEQELEMFRAFREKRLRERRKQKED
ncbi:helix-turn-helix transcriptional regulator [Paenibacillus sp. PL2-23]|uniref:helix-turn-helix domain-containing protein n=1 Tax=Paenibacillus sp. PL2-23 TaxID=2100729 RepID=UPI0030F9AAC3